MKPTAAILESMASAPTDALAAEHEILIGGCGLVDRSERGKLALSGPGAVEFLNGQVTNELTDLAPGEGRYAAFLTHKGKMLGDLRILAPARGAQDGEPSPAVTELLLDTERCALQALFDMIRRFKVGYEVQLDKRTLERGLLSLIGPGAAALSGADGLAGAEHSNTQVDVDGTAALAIRTDVGIDLLCDSADTAGLSLALRSRGAEPVSEQAAECVRIERGRPRFGVDIDDSVIPQEAGLNDRAVSFTKGCTSARRRSRACSTRANRTACCAACAWPSRRRTARSCISASGRSGRSGSCAVSPALGPIALAIVPPRGRAGDERRGRRGPCGRDRPRAAVQPHLRSGPSGQALDRPPTGRVHRA